MTPEAFNAGLVASREKLRRYALRWTRNRVEADDIVQETLVKALAARDRFTDKNMAGWLYTILHNEFINLRTRARPTVDVEDVVLPTPARQDRVVEAREMLALIATLADHRRLPLLALMDGADYEGMARRFGMPVGTIKSNVHRARLELAARTR